MDRFEETYYKAKDDEWFRRFVIFCRIALAANFLIAGYIKIVGERSKPSANWFENLSLSAT